MTDFSGLTVVSIEQAVAAPYASGKMADGGARVIKIERPGAGDDTRFWGPPYVEGKDGNPTSESGYYLSANRNKRSLAIDITSRRLLHTN